MLAAALTALCRAWKDWYPFSRGCCAGSQYRVLQPTPPCAACYIHMHDCHSGDLQCSGPRRRTDQRLQLRQWLCWMSSVEAGVIRVPLTVASMQRP